MPPTLIDLLYGPIKNCQLYVIGWGEGANIFRHAIKIELHCSTSRMVSGSIPGGVTGDFFRIYRQNICPGFESASKNEYQGFLLG